MSSFVIDYTIHFDDTMAYGGHHFLTSFKFQCAARESFLFGERVFDVSGVREALDQVHLLTSDAYARNLHSAQLGDRVAIFLTLEDWGRVSARFCYRVIDNHGHRVCAGFQTLICADARSGNPMPMPPALRDAMDAMREIEEPVAEKSFRDRILSGGGEVDSLFGQEYLDAASRFLTQRYPGPQIIDLKIDEKRIEAANSSEALPPSFAESIEAWCFSGQGAFDATLFSDRVNAFCEMDPSGREQLAECAAIAAEILEGDAQALCSGSVERCEQAILNAPLLSQVGIHLQNVLGAKLRKAKGFQPKMLMGHSFGEIAAFETAGCFNLQTGVRVVCHRAREIEKHAPADGGLLVVFAPRHRIETELELLGLDRVCLAGRNHHEQTVASGPLEQLTRLGEFFGEQGVNTVRVASPTSFHHPELKTAAASWLTKLRQLDLQPPKRAIYSPIGRRTVTAKDDIAAVLASQLLRPFDFQGAISDVIKMGINTFVDCGSTGALSNLISRALPDDSLASVMAANDGTGTQRLKVLGKQVSSHGLKAFSAKDQTDPSLDRRAVSSTNKSVPLPSVSIVGCGCLLPGGARSPDQLFEAILQQRMGIVDQREYDPNWSEDFYSETLVPDRSTSHLSGRVDDRDIQVPREVSPEIFGQWTRSQRLLAVALSGCLESLKGAQRITCLIGATADGFEDQDDVSSLLYAGIDPTDPEVDRRMNTARSFGRTPHDAVQEVIDQMIRPGLQVTLVDAACASSLYTVAMGMRLLESGQADAVVAGGCFCPGRGNSCLFSQFGGTTSTGCRPFDAGADGVVFSEGAAVVTLRRTLDAEKYNLSIEANLLGAGLSSDGRSSSANVPQTNGQILSLERCYANYGLDPSTIRAVEAHGTSTPVGDSTEVETLRRFFANHLDDSIPIHSLKSNLGHAGWAAGTASIIAACQYIKRGSFPAQAFHRQPSPALEVAGSTLRVAKEPVSLGQSPCCIAIDGFGFGGANAHMVLGNYRPPSHGPSVHGPSVHGPSVHGPSANGHGPVNVGIDNVGIDDLVFVACHEIQPELETSKGRRFDRENQALPKGMLALPELVDDMDISQTLAVNLASDLIKKLDGFDQELRQETSIVLAMSGKTERGVEATTRIMTERFRRQLAGDPGLLNALETAHDRARPSRSYTLQCMMPNVAAGRAALMMNFNGPNFVVDAGAKSIDAAISAAELLLQDGTSLVIVGAIDANSKRLPDGVSNPSSDANERSDEYALAFGLTTRAIATKRGWGILGDLAETRSEMNKPTGQARGASSEVAGTCSRQVKRLFDLLYGEAASERTVDSSERAVDSEESESASPSREPSCLIHAPVWVEKSVENDWFSRELGLPDSAVVIIPADANLLAETLSALPNFCPSAKVFVVGDCAADVVSGFDVPNVLSVCLDDEASLRSGLESISDCHADTIVVLEQISGWDPVTTLSRVANDTSVCELLFLVAQRYLQRLRDAKTDVWGVYVGGWRGGGACGGTVHPQSGAVAGLLKSIQREIPATRTGTICTRGGDVGTALRSVCLERQHSEHEVEVVYDGRNRWVRRLRPTPLTSNPSPQVVLSRDSVVVASGGARGVTAVMLEELAREHQCTVVALGRSPLEVGPRNPDDPSVEEDFYRDFITENPNFSVPEMRRRFQSTRARWEAHQTIDALRKFGGHVEYRVVDVTDADEVSKAIDQIADRFGRVDLLIHGAGVQFSKRLQDRTLSEFRKTFQVKVAGLHHLAKSCQERLGHTVPTHVLTSAYSVFGNDGQHDYGAANETMDRICAMHFNADKPSWSSLAWLAWDGIGMTRGSEYRALSKQRSLSGMTATMGQQIFRDVLAGRTGAAINVPLTNAEHVKYELNTVPLRAVLSSRVPSKAVPMRVTTRTSNGQAVIGQSGNGQSGNGQHARELTLRMLERSIDLSKVECLDSHLVRNTPTLPGAWIVNYMVDTAMKLHPDSGRIVDVTVEDTTFKRFVRVTGDRDPNARVLVEKAGDSIHAMMICDLLHPTGRVLAKDVVCASAKLTFQWDRQSILSSDEFKQPASRLFRQDAVADPYCNRGQSTVDLSGAFDCLREIQIGDRERKAVFCPDQRCQWFGAVPALLLDAAWRVGAMYSNGDPDRLFVPVKIGRMVLPMNGDSLFSEASGWSIRSTTPTVRNTDANWTRTEVFDQTGTVRMLVENAAAAEIDR